MSVFFIRVLLFYYRCDFYLHLILIFLYSFLGRSDGNDEKVAAKIDYLVASHNGVASVRLKMKQSGNIIAAFVDANNNIIAIRRVIKISLGVSPVAGIQDYYPELMAGAVRTQAVTGTPSRTLQVLFSSSMDWVDYITRVRVQVDSMPIAVVYFTPYIASNPYLKLAFSPGAQSIVLDVNATGDRSVASVVSVVPMQ